MESKEVRRVKSEPDVLTALTSLAVEVFRERSDPSYRSLIGEAFESFGITDPILRDAQRESLVIAAKHPSIPKVVERIFSSGDLSVLGSVEGQLDPLVLYANGGTRMSPESLMAGLLTSALLQMYCLRLRKDESTFVRTVLAGFEELRRAVAGEQVRAHRVHGIAGITLPEGSQVSTPWGVVRPAPAIRGDWRVRLMFQPETTCMLAEPRLVSVKFDRAASPEQKFDPAEGEESKSLVLFPLACALASGKAAEPVAPLVTWSTSLLPFGYGLGYTFPVLPPRVKPPVDMGNSVAELEEWSRTVDSVHVPSVDVAARRIVSASGQRMDTADALIDAVMVWENLVGTSAETTFRVTASIAKALEPDKAKRRALQKTLKQIYDIRSRVVHGVAVDQVDIHKAATKAVGIAIEILAFSYRRGRDWLALTSTDRADLLLLTEP
jgi:hypothetical protein